jgi:hypothetical protein
VPCSNLKRLASSSDRPTLAIQFGPREMESLCSACRSINLYEISWTKIPGLKSGAKLTFWTIEELDKTGYNHIRNARDLFISAKSCKLCSPILRIANNLFKLRVRSLQLDGLQEFAEGSLLLLPIKFASPEAYVVPCDGRLGLNKLQALLSMYAHWLQLIHVQVN